MRQILSTGKGCRAGRDCRYIQRLTRLAVSTRPESEIRFQHWAAGESLGASNPYAEDQPRFVAGAIGYNIVGISLLNPFISYNLSLLQALAQRGGHPKSVPET